MPESTEDHCERCGQHAPGRRKLMFYRALARFPEPPIAREFFCFRCIRIMRIYATIALVLGAIVIGGLIVAAVRVNSSGSIF